MPPNLAAALPGRRVTLSLVVGATISLLPGATGFLVAQQGDPHGEAPDEAALGENLESGSHAVGFRVDWLVDSSRSGPGSVEGDGRLLRIYTWYPAVAGTGEAMTFRDYLAPQPPEGERWATLTAYLDERDASTFVRQFSPASESASDRLRRTPVPAHRDATMAEGPFPLVLHSLGRNDYQLESTVLWEHLASHGYVVSVAPQLGTGNDSPTLAFEPADMELQAADLALVLNRVGEWPAVHDGSVGVIGHSSGGIAALLLARREPRVDAIVGLDASFGTADGRELLAAMGDPQRGVDAALLDLHARAKRSRDTAVIDAMAASARHSIAFGGIAPPRIATHFDFQNWPLYAVLAGIEDDRAAGARPARWAADVFLSSVRLTRSFLDAHLRNGRGTWRPELTASPLDSTDLRVRSRPADDGRRRR